MTAGTNGVVAAIVSKRLRLGAEPDWDQVTLRELGLDSMSAIELVLDLEAELDIVIPDSLLVVETFATLRSLEAALAPLRNPTA